MMDTTGDWCFEGGCTYIGETGHVMDTAMETDEREEEYGDPCIGMYD